MNKSQHYCDARICAILNWNAQRDTVKKRLIKNGVSVTFGTDDGRQFKVTMTEVPRKKTKTKFVWRCHHDRGRGVDREYCGQRGLPCDTLEDARVSAGKHCHHLRNINIYKRTPSGKEVCVWKGFEQPDALLGRFD